MKITPENNIGCRKITASTSDLQMNETSESTVNQNFSLIYMSSRCFNFLSYQQRDYFFTTLHDDSYRERNMSVYTGFQFLFYF